MEQRNKTAMMILLMVAAMIMGGCGWISGGDNTNDSSRSAASSANSSTALRAVTRMVYTYSIYTVDPNEGFIEGGEAIRITGNFPDFLNASNIYTVYIGDNVAAYDNSFTPFYSSTDLYVIAPPGDTIGLTGVGLFDKVADVYAAYAEDAYRYVDSFDLFFLDPDAGELAGGTAVTVNGQFPVASPITNLVQANFLYNVKFDGVRADFVPNALGEYITANAMYITTPPGAAPGFVDVVVAAAGRGERTRANGFRYFGDFELAEVDPDRGHVSGGDLIRLGGSFPVASSIYNLNAARAAYTVYFGPEPADFADFSASTMGPIITADTMYVISPVALSVGTVDVNIWSIAGIYSTYATVYSPPDNDFEYFRHMKLAEIYPDNGRLGVNTRVQVLAKLPITADVTNLATANAMYSVEIDGDPATFSNLLSPMIEITGAYGEYNALLNMFTPPGTSIGLKDAALIDISNIEIPAKLPDAYTYNALMELVYVYPFQGPTTGGQQVDILVDIPLATTITDLATADSIYTVLIDGNVAPFDLTNQPLISASVVYSGYSIFHMLTPAGTLGFKDVTLIDEGALAEDAILLDGYEYIADGGIGQWTETTIGPNPVGPLDPGELLVTVTVTGDFDTSFQAFIVPQGGDPVNQNHRIALDQVSVSGDTWTGTNAIAIATDMYGSTGLYADGHAAIYLFTDTDGIVGDDYVPPYTDGSKISGSALINRHFIIDTIPPRMIAPGIADDNFIQATNVPNRARPRVVDIPLSTEHPYPLPATLEVNVTDFFPFSTDSVSATPGSILIGEQRAQRFFNVASFSNFGGFPPVENLQLQVFAEFEDIDVDTFRGTTPNPSFADKFNGDTFRQPAGFSASTTNLSGDQDAIITGQSGDGDVRARWVLQGGSSPMPDIDPVAVEYLPTGTSIVSGFVYQQTNVPSVTSMLTTWDMTDGIYASGIDPMHIITKFAAGDRATIYYPRGNTSLPARSVMTPRADQLDPLHIWWMREVGTSIFRDNIPADGVTQSPNFAWDIANRPRPEFPTVAPSPNDPHPLHYYALWKSPQSLNLEEFRDGPFTLVDQSVPLWSPTTSLFPNLTVYSDFENSWFLFTVLSIDEAGNAEIWPSELTGAFPGFSTINVASGSPTGGTNWRRLYYPSGNTEIDTLATPTFWHDSDISPLSFNLVVNGGERVFGSQTIIPLPPKATYFPNGNPVIRSEQVSAQFAVQSVNIPSTVTDAVITWELIADGELVVAPTSLSITPGVRTIIPVVTEGDPSRIKPVNYVFRATARYTNGSATIVDSTPVNIRFTVVPDDDIAKFLRNVNSDDQQPIKEFDRP